MSLRRGSGSKEKIEINQSLIVWILSFVQYTSLILFVMASIGFFLSQTADTKAETTIIYILVIIINLCMIVGSYLIKKNIVRKNL
ncbi:hypothetical protein AN396_10265 [Candidatus Epulonipiscium fishelsonii]|uniref:Uncharacterized protein n=1 Tax=Candidatus Epulonipiscium fishelsonii TaxID=77094 RepID=A0ACC8X9C0_9FIRM|nr:hypothetical protein AN396_10265 [Epulopiscium sp. SCG-B11WGA-EpuloA1]